MNLKYYRFDEVTVNFDKKRVPLSSAQRSNRGGEFPYYGAQGVIDHIDDYIFDGEYLLIAEDGENLKSKKQNITQIATGKFWVNNHAHIVTGNEKCDTRYLCYLINSMDLSGYITGSAQPKLSQANLNAVQLSMPTLEQQKRIVEYLVAIDNKIALNELINNNLPPHPCYARIAAKQRRQTPNTDECLHTDGKVSDIGSNEETAKQFSSILAA